MGNNLDKQLIQRSVKLAGEVHRRKSTEEKLRKTEDILEALIQASPAGITLLDKNGIVQVWNRAAERIFGWTAKEVLGRPLPTIPPGKQEEHRIFRERVLRGE
jgi:PAS domain S-box-containing protein